MAAKRYRKQWVVDFVINLPSKGPTRIRRKSPDQTKQGAEEFEHKIRADLLTLKPSGPERELRDFAVEFLETYAAVNNKLSTIESKERILRNHLLPALGHLNLSDIRPAVVEGYKADKIKAGLKSKTINNHLGVLSKCLAVAVEWEMLESAPLINKLPVQHPEFDFLTFEESDRLVAGADDRGRVMIIVALKTGLRIGELRGLKWEDIDLSSGRLTVRRAVVSGVVGSPKNNKTRTIPLSKETVAELRAYRHLKGEWVFCKDDGGLLTRAETKWPLYSACRRAGLRRINWHVLRHTFASHLVMRGAPLKVVQELLGHSTVEMTMRYAHLSPEVSREAVDLLDRPTNWNKSGTFQTPCREEMAPASEIPLKSVELH